MWNVNTDSDCLDVCSSSAHTDNSQLTAWNISTRSFTSGMFNSNNVLAADRECLTLFISSTKEAICSSSRFSRF